LGESYSAPIQAVVGEFKNISPEITSAFVFRKSGEINANNEAATVDQIKRTVTAFNNMCDWAQVLGGVETLTIQGADRQLNIECIHSRYLATVSSRAVDLKAVNALTHVIVPTVIELVDQTLPYQAEQPQSLEEKPAEQAEAVQETLQDGPSEVPAVAALPLEPMLPWPNSTQLMVERIGGLLVPSDTVRIDSGVIAKWEELYPAMQVTLVSVETLEGLLAVCKFKPIKDGGGNSKGIIQVPEKILQTIQTSKGKLVIVKPVLDNQERQY
jgi:hypothetical protein